MLDTRIVGGNDIPHLNSLRSTERVIGDNVESHQCTAVVLEGLERLRGDKYTKNFIVYYRILTWQL